MADTATHHDHPPLLVVTRENGSHSFWQEIRTLGPHPHRRSYHTVVAWTNYMIVYGGQDLREGMVPGLWIFHFNETRQEFELWEEMAVDESGPPPLCRHTAVIEDDQMYVFGGTTGFSENQNVYIMNLATKTWTVRPPDTPLLPPAIDSHSSVVSAHRMIVFGGFVGGSRSDLIFVLDLPSLTWSAPEKSGPTPCPRSGHSAVAFQDWMYVFGGTNDEGGKLADLWKVDLRTFLWEQIQTPSENSPEGRSGHTAACYRSYMIVFGGMKELTKETNELWAFRFDQSQWILVQEERRIEDPVSAVQLEEYKRSRSPKGKPTGSPIHTPGVSPKMPGSPMKARSGDEGSPDESQNQKKKRTGHLYEGPPSPLVGRIVGREPYPRDGHSAVIVGDKMIVFGGDRYQMPFNDMYAYVLHELSLKPTQVTRAKLE